MRKMISALLIIISSYALAGNFFYETPIISESTFEEPFVDTTIFPASRPSSGRNIFVFSPQKLAWAVYNQNGIRVGIGKASGGKDFCTDINKSCRTVVGEFTVFRTEDKDCTSKTYPIDEGGGAPMPHCMFFYKGYAIHGSKYVGDTNRSHGCIRVSEEAAEWMNQNYIGPGALVIVEPYAA